MDIEQFRQELTHILPGPDPAVNRPVREFNKQKKAFLHGIVRTLLVAQEWLSEADYCTVLTECTLSHAHVKRITQDFNKYVAYHLRISAR